MNSNDPDKVTFQVTVVRLTVASRLPKQDIRVTVCVGDVSKITCSGTLSRHRLKVTWKHPFLFTAKPSTAVKIAMCALPEELTPSWDKQPLGKDMVTNVSSLLECNEWQCIVPGLSNDSATLSMACKVCEMLTLPHGHYCMSALAEYDMKLYEFGQQIKNVSCMSTQIELGLARLDLCPSDHADYTVILSDLACSFLSRYDQEGNIPDLNRDIEISQIRLNLCPLGHPEHVDALGELASSLSRYYNIQENKADLDRLIEMHQRWLDLCPPGHPNYARAFGDLALLLQDRFHKQWDITDLDMAIEMGEKSLDLCPKYHPDYDTALGNLAVSLYTHYHSQGNLADLNRAIDLEEKRLEICPPGHQNHGLALLNLAMSLKYHFNAGKDHSDLIRAIKLLREGLDTYPVQHSYFALIAGQLAAAILTFKSSHSAIHQSHSQVDESFEIYRLLKKCVPAVSQNLWNAIQDWVKNAEKHDHPSILEAYQTSLNMLDHFISFNSSLDSRHETMQAKVADLANDAFSCAIRYGNLQLAVELLEQGRGIMWSQLAHFDASTVALERQGDEGCKLRGEFVRLSADLRKHAEGSGNKGMDPYWRVQEQWELVVHRIRGLDGFSQFLLPPRFEDLQHAAEHGPVIIINASERACDALIVLATGPPVHVPLPCSLSDVIQFCSQISELTQDSHAYGDNRESWLKLMLRELWLSVVEPIVTVLQNDVQLPTGSRIWWCPTSKFTVLPIHATGPHQKSRKDLMDIYVSSYAPSLSALVRTRDRLRCQKQIASGTPNGVSFVAVGQAQPSKDTKLSNLPEVELEIQKIRNETNMTLDVKFETVTGAAATIESAIQAFRNHRWVHVACHGAQHAEKPFESWFAMRDGKLTLRRIIQERYTNSDFAFLSACHTAVGDESTPDEVLHLAAGMQFAGFSGVIGTLWRVDDAVAHQVVTRFYKEMFDQPRVDFEHAAAALNTAVVKTTKEVSLEKRIVFVHIGI